MRLEVFLKNGKKRTIDNVIRIINQKGYVMIDYEKQVDGNWTTNDEPSFSFEAENIDTIKVVDFD